MTLSLITITSGWAFFIGWSCLIIVAIMAIIHSAPRDEDDDGRE